MDERGSSDSGAVRRVGDWAAGVGKTAFLAALHDALTDDGIGHAVVEVEALSWAYPWISDEQSFEHLQATRRGYVKAGFRLLVCGATVTSQTYLDRLLEVVSADESLVVRLEADPTTLRERIIDREPPEWSGLNRLLAASRELAALSQTLERVDLVLSAEEMVASVVAERIRAARPDVLAR
jgi:hypothetical protein